MKGLPQLQATKLFILQESDATSIVRSFTFTLQKDYFYGRVQSQRSNLFHCVKARPKNYMLVNTCVYIFSSIHSHQYRSDNCIWTYWDYEMQHCFLFNGELCVRKRTTGFLHVHAGCSCFKQTFS